MKIMHLSNTPFDSVDFKRDWLTLVIGICYITMRENGT